MNEIMSTKVAIATELLAAMGTRVRLNVCMS